MAILEGDCLVSIRVVLKILDGKTVETIVTKESFTVGRSLKCDVSVPSEGLSRTHCRVELEGGEFYVTDLGSANGVMIDDVRIPSDTRTKFFTSSNIFFGNVEVQEISYQEATPVLELDFPVERRPQNTTARVTNERRSAEEKPQLHPGLRGMLIVMLLAVAFFGYKIFFAERESESDVLDRALYESNMKNRNEDGTVKTRNF